VLSARAKLNPDSDKNRDDSCTRIPLFRVVTFCTLGLLGFAADILTKSYIETTTNPGALFGMFPGQRWLFAILSMVALVSIILWLFVFGGARDRWLTMSLGLVSGGILGNLYDRMGFGFRPNYPSELRFRVRDWIYFRLEGVPWFDPWPNFNIADSLLVSGAILLVLHSFLISSRHGHTSES
jgi:signal peptidase II